MWILFLTGLSIGVLASLSLDASSLNWRTVDLIALGFGSVGIVSAIAEARRMASQNHFDFLNKPRVNSSLAVLNSLASTYLGIIRMRIESSASNLSQYQSALPWFEAIAQAARQDSNLPPTSVAGQLPSFSSDLSDREILALHGELNDSLERYEVSLTQYRQKKSEVEASGAIQDAIVFATPLFITIAVSLALFKILAQP